MKKEAIVAIVLARGGSKGIPHKNITDFCGKPLIAWTIEQLKSVESIDSVWVSSDSDAILDVSEKYGAQTLKRPAEISGDTATSECAWLHAIETIEAKGLSVDLVVAPQVTSPLRHATDFERGIEQFYSGKFDSLFSCSVAEDFFFWEVVDGKPVSVNYDYKNRKRRQDFPKQYVENGSFYIFKPEVLRTYNNRLGGSIGFVEMEFWKMFEIDAPDDLKMCAALMKSFLL